MSLAAQRCLRLPTHALAARRLLSSTRVVRARDEDDGGFEFDSREALFEARKKMSHAQVLHAKFKEFFVKDDSPGQFLKDADQPRNWLAPKGPFPLNPTFRPPPPTSDKLRSRIYALYMQDPNTNSVRQLSTKFGISMKRIDAILRLKGLEGHMVKNGEQLQTGFRAGMEFVLGVTDDLSGRERYDVNEADMLDEEEGNDRSRERYQHLFWESVVEGEEPLVPGILQKAQKDSAQFRKDAWEAKSHPDLVPSHADSPRARVQLVSKPGRPTLRFVDVGGKFLEVKAVEKRMAQSDKRRAAAEKTKMLAREKLDAYRATQRDEPRPDGWSSELKKAGY